MREKLEAYAWPGGYPLFHLVADGGILCAGPQCANGPESRADDAAEDWRVIASDVHWEGEPLHCDHCGRSIESAYGVPEGEEG
jgi:hypothetical protein